MSVLSACRARWSRTLTVFAVVARDRAVSSVSKFFDIAQQKDAPVFVG